MAFSLQDEFSTVQSAIDSGTFDPQGADATYAFSPSYQMPASTTPAASTLPAIGGSASNASGNPIASAAADAGITGGATPPASTTGNVASSATANNWFVRAIIVILGFIFVAVGLSQFGVVQRGIGR